MTHLYHLVPENMQGDILYPLNLLKEKYPDICVDKIKKYELRSHIMEQKIPYLDCLWNDVLFFTAVDPLGIRRALISSGDKEPKGRKYYKIDPLLLDPKDSLIYLYSTLERQHKMDKSNFAKYDPIDLVKYSRIPEETKAYYREQIDLGKRPLLWHQVPHILYKSSLSVGGLEIIEA